MVQRHLAHKFNFCRSYPQMCFHPLLNGGEEWAMYEGRVIQNPSLCQLSPRPDPSVLESWVFGNCHNISWLQINSLVT